MLSPPYSPHPDLIDPQYKGVVADSTAALLRESMSTVSGSAMNRSPSLLTAVAKGPAGVDVASATSSSSEEYTDNDTEESSGSVPPEERSPSSIKRAASEAFVDDCEHPVVRERRMTTCWDALKSNPAKYLRRERSLLVMYPMRRHSWAGPSTGSSFMSEDSSESAGSGVGSGAKGPGRGRRAHRTGSGTASNSGRGRRRATPQESSASGASAGDDTASDSASGSRTAHVRVHDLSLNQIEDYSPSVQTLPPGKSLRAEWKGAPMDLSNDPDLHLLHPAEAHLASVLRLPCEVYLDSKRRLFAEKVHRLRQGLPFRRTDSQKACRIDVNKASRLFGAFEKIGWLDDELFLKYLS